LVFPSSFNLRKIKSLHYRLKYYIIFYEWYKFARSVRGDWGMENVLHLAMDVIFEEDKDRYQDKIGAATSFAYRDHLFRNCFSGLVTCLFFSFIH
jgi:predicted transposase YbfD/YdcC